MSPSMESYITIIDGTLEHTQQDNQTGWEQAASSLLSNPDFPLKDAYARGLLEMSLDRGYSQMSMIILDYYRVPANLDLKQRLAYFNILGGESIL